MKALFAETLQVTPEAKMYEHLGYEKHDMQNKQTTKRRNDKSKKNNIMSEHGDQEIAGCTHK
ncbi:hypothetical protein ACFOLF_28135 [Paenibacillus sepulcri]|uniref:Uncharacterized protein n=1 Tax=Paenibacillus sepulcri TaxID=359917 RepID=A0ABS7CEV8_9BACL|nr:hypothetical protein [Paenibacillus sepulcri]